MTFLNVDSKKSFKFSLPSGRILQTFKITNELFPEHLFDESQINKGVFRVTYRYQKQGHKGKMVQRNNNS